MNRPLTDPPPSRQLPGDFIDLALRLGLLAFLIYSSFVIVRPFLPMLVWGVILTVALYPTYAWLVARLGGRRGLAAALITMLGLLVLIGPVTWLGISLIEALPRVVEFLGSEGLPIPAPPEAIRRWPLIGEPLYENWVLASTNLKTAVVKLAPHLKSIGTIVLSTAGQAGTGILVFLASFVVAGFLFVSAPTLVAGVKSFSSRVASERGEAFVELAGATIRTVSRGVIGISVLQATLIGIGFIVAEVPAAGLLTFVALFLGIIQVGPSIVTIPVLIWAWMTMETTAALLFTAYMIPVNLIDNILRPVVMGRGLRTPALVIFIGVIGGTLAHGIIGLFVGPVVLAVAWELLAAWMSHDTNAVRTK